MIRELNLERSSKIISNKSGLEDAKPKVNTGISSVASMKDLHKIPLDPALMNMNLKSTNMIQALNNFNTFASNITTNTDGNQNNVASHSYHNVSLK